MKFGINAIEAIFQIYEEVPTSIMNTEICS